MKSTSQELKKINLWQKKHGKEDELRFKEIIDLVAALPTEESITNAVANSVQKTVNGKIDGIKQDIKDVKMHLTDQDMNLEALSKKIRPFDQAKTWVREFAQIIMYVGGLCLAITAILGFLHYAGIIK